MTPINGLHIEGILLDIDGTIADTDDAAVARVERWFRFVRWLLKNQDPHVAARRFVMRVESPVNALVGWLDRTGLDQIFGPIMNSLHRLRGLVGHTQVQLIPGVKKSLERLADRYPLYGQSQIPNLCYGLWIELVQTPLAV
jgi:beta-phosphoglucomutase-like phosphatase (HAD superfamily)